MKADLELVITHDGRQWIARNADIRAVGQTQNELDRNLADILRSQGKAENIPVTVFMRFDFNTLPTWLRQYASHYFNRYVYLKL